MLTTENGRIWQKRQLYITPDGQFKNIKLKLIINNKKIK